MSKKYAFVIDLRKCVGCGSCQVSCKMENGVPHKRFRSVVEYVDTGKFPDPKRYFVPKLCNNCDNPPCVSACPVKGATFKMENGVVAVNQALCIGCMRCADACPYGARYADRSVKVTNDPAKYQNVKEVAGKTKKELFVVDKCDYCLHRIYAFIEEPACVRNCPGHARYFGDVNDSSSMVHDILKNVKLNKARWGEEYGTNPTVVYILKEKDTFEVATKLINEEV